METLFTQIQDAQQNVDTRMLGPKTPDQLAGMRADQLAIDSAQEHMIRRGAVAVAGLISGPGVNEATLLVPAQAQQTSQSLTRSIR